MKNKTITSIIFCIVAFFICGCASKPTEPQESLKNNAQVLREAVIETVKDVERQQKLLSSIESLEKVLLDYNKDYGDFVKEINQQNRVYETPRAQFEQILKSFRDKRKNAMETVAALHFEMVANTTEDEWKKIVKKEVETIKQSRRLPEDQFGG